MNDDINYSIDLYAMKVLHCFQNMIFSSSAGKKVQKCEPVICICIRHHHMHL